LSRTVLWASPDPRPARDVAVGSGCGGGLGMWRWARDVAVFAPGDTCGRFDADSATCRPNWATSQAWPCIEHRRSAADSARQGRVIGHKSPRARILPTQGLSDRRGAVRRRGRCDVAGRCDHRGAESPSRGGVSVAGRSHHRGAVRSSRGRSDVAGRGDHHHPSSATTAGAVRPRRHRGRPPEAPALVPEQAPQRGLDPILQGPADGRIGERHPRRLARLGQRIAERLQRGDDLAFGRAEPARADP
jgi:hypothetical protein